MRWPSWPPVRLSAIATILHRSPVYSALWLVGKVRTVATDNAVKASRAVVFGVLALISLVVATPLITILGLVFAIWLLVLGVVTLLLARIGFVFEYYVGEFAD